VKRIEGSILIKNIGEIFEEKKSKFSEGNLSTAQLDADSQNVWLLNCGVFQKKVSESNKRI
jgi:hypothetical protein